MIDPLRNHPGAATTAHRNRPVIGRCINGVEGNALIALAGQAFKRRAFQRLVDKCASSGQIRLDQNLSLALACLSRLCLRWCSIDFIVPVRTTKAGQALIGLSLWDQMESPRHDHALTGSPHAILIHGAWQGSWVWHDFAPFLRRSRFRAARRRPARQWGR
jgi:hypothetical protein